MGSHYGGGQYKVYIRFPEKNARNRRRLASNCEHVLFFEC